MLPGSMARRTKSRCSGAMLLDRFALIRIAVKYAESRRLVVERTCVGAIGFRICHIQEKDRVAVTVVRTRQRAADPA